MSEREARLAALDALARAGLVVRHFLDDVAARNGLSGPQARLVSGLVEPMPMAAAAAAAGCEPSHLTSIAGQLEEAGLVRRDVDPHDRRVRRVRLTRKGSQVRTRLLAELETGAPIVRDLDEQQARLLTRLLSPSP
ncbi:DNA-binding MarR family transcriptional regulator [Kineosphaera limosa]|uniref:Putative MarR family transcriptional regulator n=1 Tax=Kineosphaera limosa NBRC 100340 TaxID=1184609 RepID=K6X7W7_9MICO|nr:MarR family winged helix-turn-helix transcriptional regulator [Kineosphaera limosa]NYE00915.1 DNA-binding MarR family transcriptional regulator [Kineosphaera limosa]GAB94889.1 putative MarR family transcriptional regulator [Kineosphaera limosa NBRC 100340]